MTQNTLLYVGTYTLDMGHVPESNGEGIHIFTMNPTTGELHSVSVATDIDNPSFLAIDPTGRYLYACSEVSDGKIVAYAINSKTGALTRLNQQSAHGSATAYVSTDATGKFVFGANYADGQSVVMIPTQADGSLTPASSTHIHDMSPAGTVPARQDKWHAHCIIPDPNNRYMLSCDLGLDKIMIYQLNADNQQLIPNNPPYVDTQAGAGPRHLVFDASASFVYVIQELNSTVAVYAYDATQGILDHQQTIPTLPDTFTGNNGTSEIRLSPDGRYLYAGNRGHDSITIYKVDANNGTLTLIEHQSTNGKTPRNFMIDPSGQFLLVANQDSHNIVTFRIDQETGLLNQIAESVCPTPVCLTMLTIHTDE